jgi:amidase
LISPGVPFTIKESFAAKGLPQTIGHAEWKDFIPAEDGWSVKQMRAAGAILVGKTNVPVSLSSD